MHAKRHDNACVVETLSLLLRQQNHSASFFKFLCKGPLLIGRLLASIAYGVSFLQTYLYFTRDGNNDRTWIKIMVSQARQYALQLTVLPGHYNWVCYFSLGKVSQFYLSSSILDSFHLGLGYHITYYYTIISFGNIKRLTSAVWSMQAIALAGVRSFPVPYSILQRLTPCQAPQIFIIQASVTSALW
jgi:hypothetical protein